MVDLISYGLLCFGVFVGAFVSGLAGFAFSAVAGVFVLHVRTPTEAVPLMMACSIVVQGVSLGILRNRMIWQDSFAFVVGGVLGIPPALYLLQRVETGIFRIGFGIFLAAYAAYMLFRPAVALLQQAQSRRRDAMVGFAGGFIGGLTAMPGALPTIWCDLRGLPKNQQRGLVQPFIAMMQLSALLFMMFRGVIPADMVTDFMISLPPLLAGTAAGIVMFGRVNELAFRRVILIILLVAGLGLLA
ncbi:sulfite exporter TauE/SafE family protein [Bradyrhizobium sp. CB3481]|uniref:sulfite exporter TauE/SafE family protein n=1 Tax=Bradyrhizobium sp. CB3481 TaxID=3039158 RepID=UPI0024B1FD72|nr:sulfite exporter TauE/SafE family protein [Bradyrhizobium sp. CB3481]WFU18584.1 sulfite exporter TauE/SafE family protein [Bradyrhizobium sp. CB3481]